MKEVYAAQIEQAVCDAFLSAHCDVSPDIKQAIQAGFASESTSSSNYILKQILDNHSIAQAERIPLCQDSGMSLIYAEVGQDVHIAGDFEAAVNEGVRRAHKEGYLRRSVVGEPLFHRENTGDGTPAVIHTRLVPGDTLKLTAVAKGFGSENCSRMRVFIPAEPVEDIKRFIVNTVIEAGAKSCPPVIVGVGIGGTIERCAEMAKTATFRDVSERNPDAEYARLEEELLQRINASGIGPGGLGGKTTALAVNIEYFATHIASVPVVVNLCCHAARHKTVVLKGEDPDD